MKMKSLTSAMFAGVLVTLATPNAFADDSATPSAEAKAPSYSTSETNFGTLFDTPETRAILEAHIAPELFENPQIDMARGMTLAQLQVFSPDVLSDEVLAAIDKDLAALN